MEGITSKVSTRLTLSLYSWIRFPSISGLEQKGGGTDGEVPVGVVRGVPRRHKKVENVTGKVFRTMCFTKLGEQES